MVKKKKPNLKYFHVFGCKCFVLKTYPEKLSKFDLKADEGIFVGYQLFRKAFRVYNLRTRVVMEYINVSFDDKKIIVLEDFNDHDQLRFENEDVNSDDLNPDPVSSDGLNFDVIETVVTAPKENALVQGEQADDHTISQDSQEASEPVTGFSSSDSSSSGEPNSDNSGNSNSSIPEGSNSNSEISESITSGGASENADGDIMDHGGGSSSRDQLPSARKWTKSHTPDLIIGYPEAGTEPKKVEEALQDADWVQAMHEKLNELERNTVWTLVARPKDITIVGTKWVFRNKTDSDGIIIRNKARMVSKGYSQ
ncbi:hypothetical protein AgCh_038145 [Apium graveolens]